MVLPGGRPAREVDQRQRDRSSGITSTINTATAVLLDPSGVKVFTKGLPIGALTVYVTGHPPRGTVWWTWRHRLPAQLRLARPLAADLRPPGNGPPRPDG